MQSLHLVVGAVVASARYMGFEPDPAQRLAAKTSAPHSYISCIADVVIAEMLVDSSPAPDGGSEAKKRKITINTLE